MLYFLITEQVITIIIIIYKYYIMSGSSVIIIIKILHLNIIYLLLDSGNIVLDSLSPKRLRQRYICGDHFETNMYMNPKAKVLTLIPNAVPKKYHNVSSESNVFYNIT